MMPRTTTHPGRAGYPDLMGNRWSNHGARVAAQGFTAHLIIGHRPTQGAWNTETQTRDSTPVDPIYDGPGRIQSIGDEATVEIAGQAVTTHSYRISIDAEAPAIETGMIVKVIEVSEPIAQLLNREFTVISHVFNTQRFQTDMIAESNQG